MRNWTTAIGGVLLAGLALLGTACAEMERGEGNEVKMKLDDVPDAARQAILREAAGAPVSEVEREEEHGKVVYEAEINSGGKRREIEVDAQGNVLPEEADDHDGGDDGEDDD